MKKLITIAILFVIHSSLFTFHSLAQTGQWIQVRPDTASSHGASGVFDPAYTPPPLAGEFNWTDKQGKFWLYDGNSLWKMDPLIGQWTWIDSSGPQGRYAGANWVDTAGNFWFFGGGGFMNDLWKYNIANNQWTKMNGGNIPDLPAIHGNIGQFDSTYIPQSCANSIGWTDANNNLWMFGGVYTVYLQQNFINIVYYNLNDLWEYNTTTNQWAWFGESGPSQRACWAHWKDSDGNFVLFGGCQFILYDCDNGCNSMSGFNDLWKYDVVNNQWTGLPTADYNNDFYSAWLYYNYPQTCATGDTSAPGSCYNTAAWSMNCDNLVFYGGYNTADYYGGLIDNGMWNFNMNTNKWTLMSQSNTHPDNGANAVSFNDNSGNLWLFSGSSHNYLWKYIPDSNCPAILGSYPVHASFIANDTSGCNPLTVTFTNSSTNSLHYLWTFGNGDSSTLANPIYTYTTSGSYTVKLFVYNSLACSNNMDSLVMTNFITVSDSVHAAFIADIMSGCSPFTVNFTNNSFNGVTAFWDFGDGNTSTNNNPTNIYNSTGIYSVKLISYGNGACSDSTVMTDLIAVGPICQSSFHAVDTIRCDSIHFVNTSINGTSYKWFFGDGDSSTSVNPVHQYPATGYYTVRLIANYNGACGNYADTMTRLNYIQLPAISNTASFHVYYSYDTAGCAPLHVDFYVSGTTNYFMEFGDGDTLSSNYAYISNTYNTAGIYTVTVIAQLQYGCADTVVHQNYIDVHPLPAPATITQHGDTLFSNDLTGNQWYWNTVMYLSSNNYIVVNNSGCYSLWQVSSFGCKSTPDSICLNFTGINEMSTNTGISIYPNPNNGSFSVSMKDFKEDLKMEIYNSIGQKVYNSILNNNKSIIDLSTQSEGIYFYRVIAANGNYIASGRIVIE